MVCISNGRMGLATPRETQIKRERGMYYDVDVKNGKYFWGGGGF